MRRATVLWEVFVTRFEEAFEQYRRQRLTGEEAGELLGMSGRHFRRLCVRYEEDGIEGLRDRRIGKISPRRAGEDELERMHALYRERYHDFTVKHFHEQLVRRHGYKLCYTVTRLSLQAAGLVLYWLTGNLVGIASQWLLNRFSPAPAPVTVIPPPKKKRN